jgi:hypothetical protein
LRKGLLVVGLVDLRRSRVAENNPCLSPILVGYAGLQNRFIGVNLIQTEKRNNSAFQAEKRSRKCGRNPQSKAEQFPRAKYRNSLKTCSGKSVMMVI